MPHPSDPYFAIAALTPPPLPRDALTPHNRSWPVATDGQGLVPELGQLSLRVREVLGLAAIFGDAFWFDGVLALLWSTDHGARQELSGDDRLALGLHQTLLVLLRKGILIHVGDLGDRFRFARPEDAARLREEITPEIRRAHRRHALRWMLRHGAREDVFWWRHADALARDLEGSELRGETAFRLGEALLAQPHSLWQDVTAREALSRFEGALKQWDAHHPRAGEALEGRASALALLDRHQEAHSAWVASIRWSRSATDRVGELGRMVGLGRCLAHLDAPIRAVDVLEQAVDDAAALGQRDAEANAREALALALELRGGRSRFGEAVQLLTRADQGFRQVDWSRRQRECVLHLGRMHLRVGSVPAARDAATSTIKAAEDSGDRTSLLRGWLALGATLSLNADLEGALTAYKEANRLAVAVEDAAFHAVAELNTCTLLVLLGRAGLARTRADETAEAAERAGDQRLLAYALERVAAVAVAQGRWSTARDALDRAHEICEGIESADGRRVRVVLLSAVARLANAELARDLKTGHASARDRLRRVGRANLVAVRAAIERGELPMVAGALEHYAAFLLLGDARRRRQRVRAQILQIRDGMRKGVFPVVMPTEDALAATASADGPWDVIEGEAEASIDPSMRVYGDPIHG